MLTPIFKNAFEEARGATSILVSSYNSKSLEIAVPIDPPAAISNQTWLKYALEKHKTPAENVTILTPVNADMCSTDKRSGGKLAKVIQIFKLDINVIT